MAPGHSMGRVPKRAQPEQKQKLRPTARLDRRREPAHRTPIDLTRALHLGHRVIQRQDAPPALTPEQRRQWQQFRDRFRLQNKGMTSTWQDEYLRLKTLTSEWTTLAEEVKRSGSQELTKKLETGTRRLIDLKRQHEALELRLKAALKAGSKFDHWFSTREIRDRPEDRRELVDTVPQELYDRLYEDVLLNEPLPSSLGELAEELRGHYLHLQTLGPDAVDFPQVDAYLERIDLLTQEMRRLGVTAEDDTLYELVTDNMRYRDSKLFNDARMRRSPPGTLTFGERILFQVEPYYLAPGSTLEVEWFWRPKGGTDTPFAGKMPGKSRKRTLTLDESFWGWVPGPVLEQQGVQVVAHLYLNGKFARPLTSEWVRLQSTSRQGLLDRVRIMAQPQRVIPGAKTSCRLSHWSPPGLGYQVEWWVNDEVMRRGARTTFEPTFANPGTYRVAARIYRLEGRQLKLFHATPDTSITVSSATDLGRETLDLFEQQGLAGLSTVRPGLEKTTAALEEKVATGGNDQGYWQRRLEAQQQRLEFLDREVPEPSSVKGLDGLAQPAEGSRFSTPVPAVMLHPEISGPVPLTLYLVLHYLQKDQWDAKLLDLTGDSPLRYPGSGTSREAATIAAIQYWQSKNPYPKGGTVSFRAAGWDGADHFSTTNFEKTAKEWIDTVLMMGGVALLLAPEFSGSKIAGTSLILASLARAGYAVYENLTLGVPWYDTRNVLEGLSILGSVAGLSGGVLRSLGAKASRAGIYRTGNALVLFGLGSDLSAAVVVTYQGLALIQAIQDDPTLDDGQKASQLMRITSMLVLNGVMTFASNRDLFTSPRGSLAGRALAPGESGSLGPKTRHTLELEVKRRGQGKQLKTDDGRPISDRQLFEIFCKVRADEQRLTDVQAELGSDRARREFGRLVRSKRRHQPVDGVTRVRLSRAFEVPVHQAPELGAGSVRVSYQVQGGQIRKIVVRCGAGTSVDDVLRHAPTVQLLKRYRGISGRFRSRLDRLRRFFGNEVPTSTDGLAFEAWGELLKLPGMIAARRKALIGRDLEAADRTRLENEIENLRRQLQTYLPRVEKLARGRGYIASESSSELPSHLQTVEQRWKIGEEIPANVLDKPDHYVYNIHFGRWMKLQQPHLGTTKIKAPYGSKEFFQFSWEKEGKNPLIYLFYLPKGMDESKWFQNALRPGKSLDDLTKILRNADSASLFELNEGRKIIGKNLTSVIDLRRLQQQAQGVAKSDLTKTSLAHPKMSKDLKTAGIGEWETTHGGFERDPSRLFGKHGQIQWVANRLGNQGFHFHVTFPRPTQGEDIDNLLTLVTHLNNYEALRMYGQSGLDPVSGTQRPGFPISQQHLGVLGAEQLEKLRTVLQNDSWKDLGNTWDFKWHFMAIRRTPYINTDRIGIEFRIYHGAQGQTPTVEIVRRTLGVIGHPEQKFDLGGAKSHGTKPYSVSQLRDLGLVPGKRALENGLPEGLYPFLKKAADVAKELPDFTIHTSQEQLLVRWSLPFLDWRRHPAVLNDKALHQILAAAKEKLIEKLKKVQRNQPIPTPETQHPIQKAIAEWANATQLWKFF